MYGETTGESDEFGLPIRFDWAAHYRGAAVVVYGHTPIPAPEWLNNTINIDTGCVFGGRLTALRYPERELVSVPAQRVYAEPIRPLQVDEAMGGRLTQQQRVDEVLEIEDVIGKRLIQTSLRGKVTVREENATAALEVMSRFAANPKWLVYLPPTMSPPETSKQATILEHPAEAFDYYRRENVTQVICEEKHMGSRAVVAICRNEDAARRQFGVVDEGIGIAYTRTGRRFFTETALESAFLTRLHGAVGAAGFWDRFNTDWILLDAELMPWSAKAKELLRDQYAAVGAAARVGLGAAVASLERAAARGQAEELLAKYRSREVMAGQFTSGTWRRWRVCVQPIRRSFCLHRFAWWISQSRHSWKPPPAGGKS
jgi:protein phosphatase